LFGVVSTLAVITLGDALGRADYLLQATKIASIEGIWHTTQPPYEPWKIVALPDDKTQSDVFSIGLPYVLTPLVTHTFDKPIPGIIELQQQARPKIVNGIQAVLALQDYARTKSPAALAAFRENESDMGYGLLAQRFAPDQDLAKITQADLPGILDRTARATIPNVFVEFWSFRIMMALGFAFLVVFAFASYYSLGNRLERHPLILRLAMWSIPLPVLASEFGWIVAENGRQPWTVFGWLPTFQSASTHSVGYMLFSLIGFALIYSSFIAAELYLMFRFGRIGPSDPGTHAAPQPIAAGLAGRPGYADKPWQ
jgi:cytochrome bd ubiquinol oxidase subunit I